jgi:hypothetical protein
LTPEESQAIIEYSQEMMKPSEVICDGSSCTDSARTSSTTFIPFGAFDLEKKVSKRVAEITRTDIILQDQLQVLRYEPGQHFNAHHDAFETATLPGNTSSTQIVTINRIRSKYAVQSTLLIWS